MRVAMSLLAGASAVEGLFFSRNVAGSKPGGRSVAGSEPAGSFPLAQAVSTPTGVIDDGEDPLDSSTTVVCDDPESEIPVSTKQLFSVMMSCNRREGSEDAALCAPYGKNGCDNESCHDLCLKMYHSSNVYEKCRCKSWGEAKKYRDFSAGAPCPLKVQPRCFGMNLYRSECEALAQNAGTSAADLVVVGQGAWPKDELNISVKENSPKCKGGN